MKNDKFGQEKWFSLSVLAPCGALGSKGYMDFENICQDELGLDLGSSLPYSVR